MQNYQELDTYEAHLLNENPARSEMVTEIQDREQGNLLCYANPNYGGFIVRAVNSHEELLGACREALPLLEGLMALPKPNLGNLSDQIHSARCNAYHHVLTAIAKATGEPRKTCSCGNAFADEPGHDKEVQS